MTKFFEVKYLPTQSLELKARILNKDKLDQFKQYLAGNSLKNFTTKLIYYCSNSNYDEEFTEAALNSLNVKELIVSYRDNFIPSKLYHKIEQSDSLRYVKF